MRLRSCRCWKRRWAGRLRRGLKGVAVDLEPATRAGAPLHDAEHGNVGVDAQHQGEYGSDGKHERVAHLPQRVTYVLQYGVWVPTSGKERVIIFYGRVGNSLAVRDVDSTLECCRIGPGTHGASKPQQRDSVGRRLPGALESSTTIEALRV